MNRDTLYLRLILLMVTVVSLSRPVNADEHGHGEHRHGDSEHEGESDHDDEHGVELSAEVLKASDITLEHAGPAELAITLRVNGQVVPIEDKTAHITPRFPGIAKEVRKTLGDQVKAGETVAVIESNQSLQLYEVPSAIAGTITKRHLTRGEFASDSTEIFEVIDLSELYVNFFVFAPDLAKIKVGQRVVLTYQGNRLADQATVSFISPLIDDATQSKFVRVRVANPNGVLSPGAFIAGDIVLEEVLAPVAVKASAVQVHEGKEVVFAKEGERFEPRAIMPGRSDGMVTEVISGLEIGEEYAAGNTFILKAELGKGSAEHEH